jgi:hypothetical protein
MPMSNSPQASGPSGLADEGLRHTATLLAAYAGIVIVGGLLAVGFMLLIQWAGLAHQPLEGIEPTLGLPVP